MGLRKHLRTAEIVEQAVFARRLFSSELGSINNVVFMVSILVFFWLLNICLEDEQCATHIYSSSSKFMTFLSNVGYTFDTSSKIRKLLNCFRISFTSIIHSYLWLQKVRIGWILQLILCDHLIKLILDLHYVSVLVSWVTLCRSWILFLILICWRSLTKFE